MTHPTLDLSQTASASGIADAIAADLMELERHVDEAMIRASAIGQSLSAGRMAANISATFGQPMFEDLSAVIPSIVALRGKVVTMHNRMDRHAQRLGVSPTAGVHTKDGGDTKETPWVTSQLTTTE